MCFPWYELEWIYGWATVVAATIGLAGLAWYAWETRKIGKETERQGNILEEQAKTLRRQGDMLVRPVISMVLFHRKIALITDVGTKVTNHSNVHAKIKLKLTAYKENIESGKVSTFKAPYPYNGDIWSFSVGKPLNGNFMFEDLDPTRKAPNEKLWILGELQTSPYGFEDFRIDPPIYYKWSDMDETWVPYPPESIPPL